MAALACLAALGLGIILADFAHRMWMHFLQARCPKCGSKWRTYQEENRCGESPQWKCDTCQVRFSP